MSIKHKFLILFLAASIIPILVIETRNYTDFRDAKKKSIISSLRMISDARESELLHYLESLKARTTDFASDGFIRKSAERIIDNPHDIFIKEDLNRHLLENKKPLDKNLIYIDVLDLSGKVIASTDPKRIRPDRSGEVSFINGIKETNIKDVQNGEEETGYLDVSAPLRSINESSAVIGAVVNRFDTGAANKIMTGAMALEMGAKTQLRGLGSTGESYLVNQRKIMVTDSLFQGDAAFRQVADTYPVRQCLERDEEVAGVWLDYRGVAVAGASMCIDTGYFKWVLISEQDEDEAFAGIYHLKRQTAVFLGMTLILVTIISLIIARSITEPIKSLEEGAIIIGKGNLDYKVGTSAGDEIGLLSRTFDEMTENLRKITSSRDELNKEIFQHNLTEKALKENTEKLTETRNELQNKIKEMGEVQVAVLNMMDDALIARQEAQKAENGLKTALREKEMLLKEVHHRVKNNLQIISSLLKLQAVQIKDEKVCRLLEENEARIRSMALIHEKLYRSGDIARIRFPDYARNLAAYLMDLYRVEARETEFNIDIEDVLLDLDTAIPCGLIINELVSNAMKHAFSGRKRGTITVGFNIEKGKCSLTVSDNGIGLPDDLDIFKSNTLGFQIVADLTSQLGGDIQIDRNSGTTFRIEFLTNTEKKEDN
jgi:two-component sensor histidine kinase/HAMP domain-containing protein